MMTLSPCNSSIKASEARFLSMNSFCTFRILSFRKWCHSDWSELRISSGCCWQQLTIQRHSGRSLQWIRLENRVRTGAYQAPVEIPRRRDVQVPWLPVGLYLGKDPLFGVPRLRKHGERTGDEGTLYRFVVYQCEVDTRTRRLPGSRLLVDFRGMRNR